MSRIVELARFDPERPEYSASWEFEPAATYSFDDDSPFLWIGLDGSHPAKLADGADGFMERTEASEPGFPGNPDLIWYRWNPIGKRIERTSTDRRFGLFELRLAAPCAALVRAYFWPRRLMNSVDFVAMMEEIEAEFSGIQHSDPSDATVRQYVSRGRLGPADAADMARRVALEVKAARACLRHARVETLPATPDETSGLRARSARLQVLPENQLLSSWYRRRLRQLVRITRNLDATVAALAKRIADAGRNAELVKEGRAGDAFLNLRKTQVLRAKRALLGLRDPLDDDRLGGDFSLTPAMQRDVNLRALLMAFRPAHREQASIAAGPLSRRPPMLATKLFELWGAVHLVNMLRDLGWQGVLQRRFGLALAESGGTIDYCEWHLQKGGETLTFELGAYPEIMPFDDVPPAHERSISAWHWAAARTGADAGWIADRAATPDYLLRLESGDRSAVGIGDASLADPKYQSTEKIDKISRYRAAVAWKSAERVIRCAPIGAFVVFPGTARLGWDKVIRETSRTDCVVLCLSPRRKDGSAALAHLVNCLRAALA